MTQKMNLNGNMKHILTYKLFEDNHNDYIKWKRKNVTCRGIKELGKENQVYGSLGKGLYTTPLSNKAMAKTYGSLYFVVNGKPKHPKVFNTLNDWEIWFQNMLIFPFSKKQGKEYPDKRDFEANTTIEDEMQKLNYDGIIIKSREMINFTPTDNVMYFKTERELENYFNNERHFGRL
jgi:hypothetical protein